MCNHIQTTTNIPVSAMAYGHIPHAHKLNGIPIATHTCGPAGPSGPL